MRRATWQWGERRLFPRRGGLAPIADLVAESALPDLPIIRNELINRDHLSANVTSARRSLMRAMLEHEAEERLGYGEGFPPDYALYLSILRTIHVRTPEGACRFTTPPGTDQFGTFWERTTEWLAGHRDETVSLERLYALWRRPPFGLRRGPMPVLALAYFLAHRDGIALYENQAFSPELTQAILDEWLAAPARIAWRVVADDTRQRRFLVLAADALGRLSGTPVGTTPLEVARALVAIVLKSPRWAQHSTAFTPRTLKLRQTVVKASDPIRLLLDELPGILGGRTPEENVRALVESLEEYRASMPALLDEVRRILFRALRVETPENEGPSPEALAALRARASAVKGLAGRLVEEAFIGRLEKFTNSRQDIEGLVSLACAKPAMQWMDADITAAETKLAELGFAFRQLEATASLRGRPAGRSVLRIVAAGNEGELDASVELSGSESEAARQLARKLLPQLAGVSTRIVLAALAEAGIEASRRQDDRNEATQRRPE